MVYGLQWDNNKQPFKIIISVQIVYRMSVSLSSVYEQTESLRQIQQKFDLALKDQINFDSIVEDIIQQASTLTMSESYRLVVLLSKHLTNNSSVDNKYTALLIIKKLILTAYHHFYIFASIRALVWISNMAKFQPRKSQYERVKLYIKQMSLKGNGDQVYQQRQCYRLLKLVDQFLPWFSQNIPTHINAQYQYRSTFARAYEQIQPKRKITSNQNFSTNQFKIFQQNFNRRKASNKQLIRQLTQFLALEVKTVADQQKYKSQLLRSAVLTADSYCIKAIVSEICALIQDNSKLYCCLKITDNLINTGQIQFVQLTKLYIVPALLNYLIPFNFVEGKKLSRPSLTCSPSEENNIVNFIYLWSKITQKVGLSTKFYTRALKEVQKYKNLTPSVSQNELGEFLTNVIGMQGVNNDKRPNISYPNVENQLIAILDSAQSSKKIANQWRPQASVINQLSQFKQSRIQKSPVKLESSSSSGDFRNIFNYQEKNVSSSRDARNSKKGISVQSSAQHILTFRDIIQTNNNKPVSQSPFKQSIKIKSIPSVSQSSFVAFDANSMSKFQQYSVRRSSPKIANQQQVRNPVNNMKQLRQVKETSQSASVVYFGRSQDFNSQNSNKLQSQQSSSSMQKKPSAISISKSNKSIKANNSINEQSTVTYRFDSSHISNNSTSNSDIRNFGKKGEEFPETVQKPSFGFKKRGQFVQDKLPGDDVVYQNILGSQVEYRNNYRNEEMKRVFNNNHPLNTQQFRQSLQSEIKDLSGGRHNFNGSIRLSEASQINQQNNQLYLMKNTDRLSSNNNQAEIPKNTIRSDKTISSPMNTLRITPQTEYFQTGGRFYSPNNYLLRKIQEEQQIKEEPLNQRAKFVGHKANYQNKYEKYSKDQFTGNANANANNQNVKQKNKKNKLVIIDEFANDRLLGLEKQLGKAIEQKNRKQQQLKKKQSQYKVLKSKSIPYMGKNMEILKKQDQIIKILANQKNQQNYGQKNAQYVKPIKNQNRLSDFFLQNQIRGTFLPVSNPFDKIFTKQILGSRCLLVSNQNFELGYNYSQVQNQISLYLTFHKMFEKIIVQVKENSLILQKPVDVNLHEQVAGYQLKLKRKVKQVKINESKQPTFQQIINQNGTSSYVFPQIAIKCLDQFGEQFVFKSRLPCSIINLAKPIQIDMNCIQSLRPGKVLRSQPLPISHEFARNYKQKIQKYFPQHMQLTGSWNLIGYSFPQRIFGSRKDEYVKFRLANGRQIQFQLFGSPKSPLAETVVSLLSSKSN